MARSMCKLKMLFSSPSKSALSGVVYAMCSPTVSSDPIKTSTPSTDPLWRVGCLFSSTVSPLTRILWSVCPTFGEYPLWNFLLTVLLDST